MMALPSEQQTETQDPLPANGRTGLDGMSGSLLTREELAKALKISIRTVDQLIADQEITPIRVGGKAVRFYLPDVIAELRSRAQTSKHPCTRSV